MGSGFPIFATGYLERIIKEIDINRITPLEALSLLTRLKDMIS